LSLPCRGVSQHNLERNGIPIKEKRKTKDRNNPGVEGGKEPGKKGPLGLIKWARRGWSESITGESAVEKTCNEDAREKQSRKGKVRDAGN